MMYVHCQVDGYFGYDVAVVDFKQANG